jgi:kumamolisin
VVYFTPNTDCGFLHAVSTAVFATDLPACLSISWTEHEEHEDPTFMLALSGYCSDAAGLGTTVCVSAGDAGSTDGLDDGKQHVGFPASSPFALACGGTSLTAFDGKITKEVVWNDGPRSATGGGISNFFPEPPWQENTPMPANVNPGGLRGRGLPDVAGNADPSTGYQIYVFGGALIVGGTSAVAPLWAGLLALVNEYAGTGGMGFLNLILYGDSSAQRTFNDITTGSNGAYPAGPGWDACTGWGSPNGDPLMQILATWAFAQWQTALV